MSKLDKLFAAAALAGALGTPGCADDCEVISDNPNSPELTTAAEAVDYCKANRNAAITCLRVSESDDKVDCSAPVYECSSASLEEDMNELFDTDGEYCVEDPAELQANL